jgi:uncharacterized phage protein (TIGR01671 family)
MRINEMRDILFRGKTEGRNSEWVYGWYAPISFSDSYGPQMAIVTVDPNEYMHMGYGGRIDSPKFHMVNPKTVGQYTDLLDKNGKKIFEGDIVRGTDRMYEDLQLYGFVGYENGSFVIVGDIITHYRWIDYELEVIGNIHDNPELWRRKSDARKDDSKDERKRCKFGQKI